MKYGLKLKKALSIVFLFILVQVKAQQGGMWIPSLLEGMNETEMKSLGSQLTAKDIYDINNASLKDAVGHFNGGCTSEMISPKGLMLTNHHCGFGQIQSHSSLENDYLKNGFWAMSLEEELPNEGLFVDFIVRIEDVTLGVLDSVIDTMTEEEKLLKIEANIKAIRAKTKKEEWQNTKVKAFYKGNQYFLFVTERFEDVRLVGAPPSSIGKFGNDADNWVFPRHTGDFSMFRVYADANNRPAKYSKDNVPYQPKHFLPISLDGVAEGDFTLVFGFPGSTDEYLPAVAIDHIVNEYNPSNIAIRDAALKVIDAEMKASDDIRIKYAAKQYRIANSWKRWVGINLGIQRSKAVEKRRDFEATFSKAIKEKGLEDKHGDILPQFDNLYKDFSSINMKHRNFIEVFLVTNELMKLTYRAYELEKKLKTSPEKLEENIEWMKDQLQRIHKNYNVNVDKAVYSAVMPLYSNKIDASIFEKSAFIDLESAMDLLEGNAKEVIKKLNNDAAYSYAKPMIVEFNQEIKVTYKAKKLPIAALQKKYMKALMEALPQARYFPDANGTLRITYGQVRGYSPRDAVYYNPVSYLEGVMEKYIPGDYDFDVPQKLQELYENKDYGQYADANGKIPVCFLGTNHTTGGNSGSPTIDAHGNLVGLNFDRVWEGTMSDLNYDPEICRNIMVDLRYVLFIVDKYAGATHLIDEMKLVHPKKN